MQDLPAVEGGKPVRDSGNFLVFGAPDFSEAEMEAVVDCMRRRWVGTGPKVHEFEQAFAAYKGIDNAIAVNSCTAALHLSMKAIDIGKGDEVITTPMTFCATVNAIIHTGATPVLADCDRDSMNITAESIAQKITPRTKAILVVHFAGRSCDMDPILKLARQHGLAVVEDCAHAVETRYHERNAGTLGDIGCFSFYVTKNITTGEGGMVVTRDRSLADKIKILALHGMSNDAWSRFSDAGYRHYQVVHAGFKYNMMDIQAVMGIEQLSRVESSWRNREAVWTRYMQAFKDLPCRLPKPPEAGTRHAYHLFTPLLDIEQLSVSRDQVLHALTKENIGVGVHYIPIHMHPFYQENYGWKRGDFPNAEFIGERTVSLPLSGHLTDQDVDDVCTAFTKVLRYYGMKA
ncbi:DegT/DnrJ/EryC1/StrS family aminotransferase [Thiohalobacter sp. IOR34]|uniref:DegT/DnrJ/EryC1/StrS family aminotransferase n=1 Tax=Thiohalobacter sp. IOR34 TaxID=3057176 RepID=UPI0025B01D3D|nr:DegT/DnrJ/EryC1/StrS family aminotransferase [Thiohalobacter sp. IOR34]WJW76290.1 DegT/DnrJ/EryC1/StrS family aminotransferase [Thiohalobacter sp. IOR34]